MKIGTRCRGGLIRKRVLDFPSDAALDQESDMHLYIELFKAKDAWLQLSVEQRAEYMQRVGSSMQGIVDAGATLVAVGATDPGTSRHAGYDFYAVWQMPDRATVRRFEEGIERDRWYDYFEQVNASGEVADFAEVARSVIGL